MQTNNNNVFRFLMGALGWTFIFIVLFSTIACQDKVHFMPGLKGDAGNDAPPVSIITAPASPTQCAAGGTVLTVGPTVTIVCNGVSGVNGTNGSDGSSCSTQSLVTGALISCTNGTSAYISNGAVGPAGSPGLPGADAPPSASITIVPLCTAATVYPTVFTEIGVCLNHKLYGVYSQNGGFMVEIVPGTYSSNGINSSCTLTVRPDCVVTH